MSLHLRTIRICLKRSIHKRWMFLRRRVTAPMAEIMRKLSVLSDLLTIIFVSVLNARICLEELNVAQALLAAEEPNYLNSLIAEKYYSVSVTSQCFLVHGEGMD